MTIPVIYQWRVPKKGFEIVNGVSPGLIIDGDLLLEDCSVLVPVESASIRKRWGDYSGLFRTFVATEPTEKGILDFADKFGKLGLEHVDLFLNKDHFSQCLIEDSDAREVRGESIDKWRDQLTLMRRMVNLWENLDEIAGDHVKWEGYERVIYEEEGFSEVILSKGRHINFDSLRPGDPIGPARAYINLTISDQIKSSHPRMGTIDDRVQLYIWPGSLKNAMWLQFGQAVMEEKKYKACEYCGTYFEIGAGRSRSTKKYCKEGCRVMAYRRKKS